VAIGALILTSQGLTGETLALGPGYRTITWAFQPDHALGLVLGMLVVRGAATVAAVGGGGVGGLFIPLAIEGALLGRSVGGAMGVPESTLFPVLGVAAFLGAGYRVPLAAVMFVAESTGKPGFVVPGLIAAAAAQLTMGSRSVSPYQRSRRTGHLEGRLDLPITSVLRTDAATVPPDATLEDLYSHHLLGVRLLSVPVVDGATYVGMVYAEDLTQIERDRWARTSVGDVARRDQAVAELDWTLGQALATLEDADTDRLPVLEDGAYVGMVTTGEILKLSEILDVTSTRERA
jgi:CBS domain-containing protein